MSYFNTHRFNIGGFAAACIAALAINGSVLLGFDHLAQSSAASVTNTASQLAGAGSPAAA